MATENKGVMVYLPKDVEEYITNFCTEYNITRKDKEGNILPSLGTGLVTYLRSQILGESPGDILAKPSKSLSTGLTKDEVLDLISEYVTSQSRGDIPSNGLSKDEVLDLINESSTNHSLAPLTEEIATMKDTILKLQDELEQIRKFDANGDESSCKLRVDIPTSIAADDALRCANAKTEDKSAKATKPRSALTRDEIVEKLGKSRQVIEARRNKGTLSEWGYRAEQVGRNWYYYPI